MKITTDIKKVKDLSKAEKYLINKNRVKEFVKDVPGDEPIGLIFYNFEEGERVWQDSFLIGKGGFITNGKPTIYLTLHSKYITEIKNDLCGTIKKANQNGDLGFQSDHNKASLLWKYRGILKYRDCFGF